MREREPSPTFEVSFSKGAITTDLDRATERVDRLHHRDHVFALVQVDRVEEILRGRGARRARDRLTPHDDTHDALPTYASVSLLRASFSRKPARGEKHRLFRRKLHARARAL